MSIVKNKNHFLHGKFSLIEPMRYDRGASFQFFKELGIDVAGDSWDDDHSTFNWRNITPHYQFVYNYEGNELQIIDWLKSSCIRDYAHAIIRLQDEIIKIKTEEFISYWYALVGATGFLGFELTTEDGKYFLEFTDDWKYHLNSNFQIKP